MNFLYLVSCINTLAPFVGRVDPCKRDISRAKEDISKISEQIFANEELSCLREAIQAVTIEISHIESESALRLNVVLRHTTKRVFRVAIAKFASLLATNKKMKDADLSNLLTHVVCQDLLNHPNLGQASIRTLRRRLSAENETFSLSEINLLVRFFYQQPRPAIAAAQQAAAAKPQSPLNEKEMNDLKRHLLKHLFDAFQQGDAGKIRELKEFFRSFPELKFDFSDIINLIRNNSILSNQLAGVLRFFSEEGWSIIERAELKAEDVLIYTEPRLAFCIFWGLQIPKDTLAIISTLCPRVSEYCDIYQRMKKANQAQLRFLLTKPLLPL